MHSNHITDWNNLRERDGPMIDPEGASTPSTLPRWQTDTVSLIKINPVFRRMGPAH